MFVTGANSWLEQTQRHEETVLVKQPRPDVLTMILLYT